MLLVPTATILLLRIKTTNRLAAAAASINPSPAALKTLMIKPRAL